jgi:hypothetical protein
MGVKCGLYILKRTLTSGVREQDAENMWGPNRRVEKTA